MLSRTANNLYWAARYLERMDHITRVVPVNYFSGLDGPSEITKLVTWEFINSFSGNLEDASQFNDRLVLDNVAFQLENPSSLISCITAVRENCRGAREVLSTELWGAINVLYHYINSYDKEEYLTTQMHAFMIEVQNLIAVCKSRLRSSLLQNEVFNVLLLGIYMERADQILRLIGLKLADISKLSNKPESSLELYEIATLLRSLESFDMSRKHYRSAVSKTMAVEFLLTLDHFPRSLAYCTKGMLSQISALGIDKKGSEKSLKKIITNLCNDLESLSKEEIEEDTKAIVRSLELKVFSLHQTLMKYYFVL